jgi:hypothetical protein
VAVLTVLVPLSIVTDLTNESVVVGGNATFQVGASGTGPLSYQWLFNGTNLAGATVNPLVLSDLTAMQAGNYQVVVTNAWGSATSAVAILKVLVPPSIVVDLTNQSVVVGASTSFEVKAEGTEPLAYQWFFDTTNLANASNDSLTLTNVTPAQAGSYQVAVTNRWGSATSSVAVLTVLVPTTIAIQTISRDLLRLSSSGAPGQTYGLQYTADLSVPWRTLTNVTADSFGTWAFDVAPTSGVAFYRWAYP